MKFPNILNVRNILAVYIWILFIVIGSTPKSNSMILDFLSRIIKLTILDLKFKLLIVHNIISYSSCSSVNYIIEIMEKLQSIFQARQEELKQELRSQLKAFGNQLNQEMDILRDMTLK